MEDKVKSSEYLCFQHAALRSFFSLILMYLLELSTNSCTNSWLKYLSIKFFAVGSSSSTFSPFSFFLKTFNVVSTGLKSLADASISGGLKFF